MNILLSGTEVDLWRIAYVLLLGIMAGAILELWKHWKGRK